MSFRPTYIDIDKKCHLNPYFLSGTSDSIRLRLKRKDHNHLGALSFYVDRAVLRIIRDKLYQDTVYLATGYNYRYGFNGKERDDDWNGLGNLYNYGFRSYDTRIVRFLCIDPHMSKFPMLTPYQYSSNNPIFYVDLDGMEGLDNMRIFQLSKDGKSLIVQQDIYSINPSIPLRSVSTTLISGGIVKSKTTSYGNTSATIPSDRVFPINTSVRNPTGSLTPITASVANVTAAAISALTLAQTSATGIIASVVGTTTTSNSALSTINFDFGVGVIKNDPKFQVTVDTVTSRTVSSAVVRYSTITIQVIGGIGFPTDPQIQAISSNLSTTGATVNVAPTLTIIPGAQIYQTASVTQYCITAQVSVQEKATTTATTRVLHITAPDGTIL